MVGTILLELVPGTSSNQNRHEVPDPLNLICFRYKPNGVTDEKKLEEINSRLLQTLNSSGKILLTQTKLNDQYAIRFVGGSERTTLADIQQGWELVERTAEGLQ